MIDPPTAEPDTSERKGELDQTADFAVQLLVEEAHLVGWTRVEFLTAVLDAANNRLSAIEEERDLEADSPCISRLTTSTAAMAGWKFATLAC